MYLQKILLICGLVVMSLMTGCASYTKPMEPITKTVDVRDDKALVILYTDTQDMRTRPLFLMDDENLATMVERYREKVFYYAEPGKRTLALATDNLLMFGGFDFVFFDAELEAGKVYYVAGHTYEKPVLSTGAHIIAHVPAMQDATEAKLDAGTGDGSSIGYSLMSYTLLAKKV